MAQWFHVSLFRFDGPLRIDYRIEAETFDGLPRSRVFFKGGDDNDKHIIHRSPELYPQSENRCKSDPLVVYIQVSSHVSWINIFWNIILNAYAMIILPEYK